MPENRTPHCIFERWNCEFNPSCGCLESRATGAGRWAGFLLAVVLALGTVVLLWALGVALGAS